jgi:hypothetical protein
MPAGYCGIGGLLKQSTFAIWKRIPLGWQRLIRVLASMSIRKPFGQGQIFPRSWEGSKRARDHAVPPCWEQMETES